MSLQGSPVSTSYLSMEATASGFYVGSVDLNPGPWICMTSTVTNQLPPSTKTCLLFVCLFQTIDFDVFPLLQLLPDPSYPPNFMFFLILLYILFSYIFTHTHTHTHTPWSLFCVGNMTDRPRDTLLERTGFPFPSR